MLAGNSGDCDGRAVISRLCLGRSASKGLNVKVSQCKWCIFLVSRVVICAVCRDLTLDYWYLDTLLRSLLRFCSGK